MMVCVGTAVTAASVQQPARRLCPATNFAASELLSVVVTAFSIRATACAVSA